MSTINTLKKALITASLCATVVATPLLTFGTGAAAAAPYDRNPEVYIDPALTSLTVHVRSWSPFNASCRYTADWYNRTFNLRAFGTQDILISPSLPEFRDWNVSVTCDDGTGTQFAYFY